MSDHQGPCRRHRRSPDRDGAGRRRPLCHRLRRRHLQHRGLSRARRHPDRLRHRARRRSVFRRHPGAGGRGRRAERSRAARARPPARHLCRSTPTPAGKRMFHYWREAAPARDLFELADWGRIAESLLKAKLVYFSGITLSLYSNAALGRFLAIVEMARQHGARSRSTAISGRAAGRATSPARAPCSWRRSSASTSRMPAYDDEAVLWGDPSPEATVERLQAFGIGEIVVKNGPNSALVALRRQERIRSGAGGGGAGRHRRRPATASTPPISRRASPATARAPRPAPRTASPPK